MDDQRYDLHYNTACQQEERSSLEAATMDRLLMNLVVDIPPVTRYWIMATVVVSILLAVHLINYEATLFYSYELCFKRKQYHRLFFSLFNYGEFHWSTIINLYIVVSHLSALENSLMANRSKLFVVMASLLVIIVSMTKYFPMMNSIGMLMHDNLIYYRNKCSTFQVGEEDNNGGWFFIDPILLTLFTNLMSYFNYGMNFGTILMTFLPGHIVFFVEKVFFRIYKKPIKKAVLNFRRLVGI